MNKRIRKKHLKKMLRELAAVYNEYEAARERIFRKAVQDLADAYGQSREAQYAALRNCIEIASILALTGPLPRSLRE